MIWQHSQPADPFKCPAGHLNVGKIQNKHTSGNANASSYPVRWKAEIDFPDDFDVSEL